MSDGEFPANIISNQLKKKKKKSQNYGISQNKTKTKKDQIETEVVVHLVTYATSRFSFKLSSVFPNT